MIASFNRKQTLKALLFLLLGGVCYVVAGLFFWGACWIARLGPDWTWMLAAGALLLITISGHMQWRRGGGFQSYHQSAFYHDLGDETAGAFVVDEYAHRFTGSAYVLSQVFLAGPLFLLRALTLFASRIPNEAGLEEKLAQTLERLRAANKWQSINEHPDQRREILLLARMGKIDFSAHKGVPRIKATSPDGV